MAMSWRKVPKGVCWLPLPNLMTASLLAVYPVIALARVGKTIIKTMVMIMKVIATLDRRPLFEAKSRIRRTIDGTVTSLCMKLAQNVRYVIGAVSIDALT